MNVALFGTSADPPTIAHATILKLLVARFDQVALWAADNPFKPEQTPLAMRHQMLELLVKELDLADRIALYPELSHPRTWTTLEQAKILWPESTFTLVVGADIVPQLPSWYRAAELLDQLQVLVVPRQGYALQAADLARLQSLTRQVEIAHLTPPKVSSSEYRKQGDRHPEDFLTPVIQAYVNRAQLYQGDPSQVDLWSIQQYQVS